MNIEMIMAFIFVIILVSIVMSTIGTIAKRSIALKERRLELEHGQRPAGEAGITPEKARQLEERLRVLERIVTQDSSSLARQIEDLRDSGSVQLPADREQVQ